MYQDTTWHCYNIFARPYFTCYGSRQREADADKRIGERHDGGEDGQPREVLEAGELGEEDLNGPKDHHVHSGVDAALGVVAVPVVAVGLVHGPAHHHHPTNKKNNSRKT
jgi:hypothetical protein